MSVETLRRAIGSTRGEIVAEVLDRSSTADGALDRLMAVTDGDPVLLCALALTALGLDEPTRRRRLEELLGHLPGETRGAPPDLTRRQREVLQLLGDGLTVQAIARRLGLSPRTVGKHLERVYRRLGTSDRLMTVMRAQHYGLLSGETVCPAQDLHLQSVQLRRG